MDGASLPRRSLDEAARFERQDHLVHGRRRDSKVLLHLGLRWRVAVNFAVVIDERQVLPLFICIVFFHYPAEDCTPKRDDVLLSNRTGQALKEHLSPRKLDTLEDTRFRREYLRRKFPVQPGRDRRRHRTFPRQAPLEGQNRLRLRVPSLRRLLPRQRRRVPRASGSS
jgi:hypothetical protein